MNNLIGFVATMLVAGAASNAAPQTDVNGIDEIITPVTISSEGDLNVASGISPDFDDDSINITMFGMYSCKAC